MDFLICAFILLGGSPKFMLIYLFRTVDYMLTPVLFGLLGTVDDVTWIKWYIFEPLTQLTNNDIKYNSV